MGEMRALKVPGPYGYPSLTSPPPWAVSSLLFSHMVHAKGLNILKAHSFSDWYSFETGKIGERGGVDQVTQVTQDPGIELWPLRLNIQSLVANTVIIL